MPAALELGGQERIHDIERPSPTTCAPIDSMLASLCWRIMRAENVSAQTPQRMPLTLFAAIMMPWPVPHRMMPNRISPMIFSHAERGDEQSVNGLLFEQIDQESDKA